MSVDAIYSDPNVSDDLISENITVADQAVPGFSDMVNQSAAQGEDWLTTAQRILTAVTMTAQQRDLMNINLERARHGQAPLDIAAYSGIGVNVGLSQGTQSLVMWGGIGLLAILAMNSLGRRSR